MSFSSEEAGIHLPSPCCLVLFASKLSQSPHLKGESRLDFAVRGSAALSGLMSQIKTEIFRCFLLSVSSFLRSSSPFSLSLLSPAASQLVCAWAVRRSRYSRKPRVSEKSCYVQRQMQNGGEKRPDFPRAVPQSMQLYKVCAK